ncbi:MULTISPECIES: alkaline shock response membrane anchor protein AmaP [Protofrankia]|uniref:Alkaline shock response membrane anchor protein AmaP n=1 Tax=Candidatus Protofrankia datiscae TaxID=2716812 RepID=F8AVR7_9ACTN|nr:MULTISPECIES: alkaline shock response membrane anchor protein AmaP [Protofrankia]AEH08255.1 hypothetical protein FsymDg_0736 [Candidatus Protofrankia datiscae]
MSGTAISVSDDPWADSPIPRLGALTKPSEVENVANVEEPVRSGPARSRRHPATHRVDRFNRVILTLLGLTLLGAGVVILLAGNGVFGTEATDQPIPTPGNRSFANSHSWFWPVVGVATTVVVLLALIWLSAQFSSSRLSRLHVTDDRFGHVQVDGQDFAAAVENELAGADGVRQVHARLLGSEKQPLLQVVVTVRPDADVHRIRSAIEEVALPYVRGTVARPRLAVELKLVPDAHHDSRVR